MGLFFHMNELSAHQVGVMLDALRSSGATLMSNSQLVNYLVGATPIAGTTYYADSTSGVPADLRPGDIAIGGPGRVPGAEYKFDLFGIDQTQFGSGWEIGAQAFVPEYRGAYGLRREKFPVSGFKFGWYGLGYFGSR